MSKGKVLFMASWMESVPEATAKQKKRVEDLGYEVEICQNARGLAGDALAEKLKDACGVIAGSQKFNENTLRYAAKLRSISRQGAGFDNIDLDYCTEHDIVVSNAFGAASLPVAEFAFSLIFAVSRRICQGRDLVLTHGNWGTNQNIPSVSPCGKTVGIIGAGFIGKTLAKMCIGVGMHVCYYDIVRSQEIEDLGAVFCTVEEALKQADYISLHVALNDKTRHMISDEQFALMKPTAYIINTSRGPVIDEEAMIRALKEGRIAGAGLDVFEHEPFDNDELANMPNVICTPHMAALTAEGKETMLTLACTNMLDVLEGRRPKFVTNPAVYEK